jgi:tetratricopeptide (TPR) repeat protein
MTGAPRVRFLTLTLVIALVAACLTVYHRVGGFAFVFDDLLFIVSNPQVAGGFSWEGIRRALAEPYGANWQPLTTLIYMSNIALFGMNAGPHHWVSLLFHSLAAVCLFLVLKRLTGRLWTSAFAAGLFAVHPVHVESVAWLTEVKDPVSSLFWLFGLVGWAHYAARPSAGRYAVVAGLFALGLLTKPIVVTFPVVLLLLDWWPLGRMAGAGHGTTSPLKLIWEKLPLFLLAGATSVVAITTQRMMGTMSSGYKYRPAARAANALVSYIVYLTDIVWPSGLAAYYPYPTTGYLQWQVIGSAALLAGVTAFALLIRRSQPWLLAGWLWYLVTLLPVLGLIQVGGQARADRYLYLPLIGVGICLAWGAPSLAQRVRHGRSVLAGIALIVLTALAAVALVQTEHWRTSVALWRRALETTRDNWVAENNYAAELHVLGRYSEALEHHREAARLQPASPEHRFRYANGLALVGQYEDAIREYRAYLMLRPADAESTYRLGLLLLRVGRPAEARLALLEVLRLSPRHEKARAALGRIDGSATGP